MTERIETKAKRLLAEGRLVVRRVEKRTDGRGGSLIVASCRGDSGAEYDLGYDPWRDQWRCTCPARGRCAHLTALMLVTVAS